MDRPAYKVLLIEHDFAFVQYARQMLAQTQAAHFDVVPVASLMEGLNRLASTRPNAVLVDLAVNDGAGALNVPLLRAINASVPIIVMGRVDDETLALEIKHAGADDYLVKTQITPPFLSRALIYAIERNAQEGEIIASEQKYHGIFDHIVEGVFQTSPSGNFLMANVALARIYGYNSADELKASVTDIARKLYVAEGRRAEFIRVMDEHDTVTDFQSQIYRKDNSIIWIAENVRAVRDGGGNLLYYEGTVEDITARKLADERIRDSENLYHSLVENLPQNIFRKNLDERFTFANQRFCQTVGLPLEKILGRTDFDLFPAELAAKYQADDRRVLEQGETFETIESHKPPAGEVIYVQVIKSPIRDSRGEISGLQGIFWDITAKKRAEDQLQAANAEVARKREELQARNNEMQQDLRMACEIQQNLLPVQYPSFPASAAPGASLLQFHHRYLPNEDVGGDFFNVLPLADDQAGVFLCDVMGHGVRSALVTAMISGLFEELKPHAADPGKFMTQLNRDLCAILKNIGSPVLTTAFYMVVNLQTGTLRYANAGHPKPFLLNRASGCVTPLANKDGKGRAALGLSGRSQYPATEIQIAADDAVVLFTDGLFEVEDTSHAMYSVEMLREAAQRNVNAHGSQLIDALLQEVQRFCLGRGFEDDVCVLVTEIAGLQPATQPVDPKD